MLSHTCLCQGLQDGADAHCVCHAVFRTGPEDLEVSTSHQQAQGFLYWCPQDNSNIYAYPLPWVPILDCETDRVTSIYSAHAEDELPEQCTAAADYASNLFCGQYRTDIKPLDIVQPEGPSFTVSLSSRK